ncbi:uracil-DNA glycosylase family protein [Bowmanella sp. JS7-9]|uniref:Uracil-DNA glycosylase family protein n=2 Tax=Pseudobowmanella zhangzhouensis TaxID=1537679 RepID=A0ABW1XNM3_9ALTE|nr:uracil-DNA glycosylase family protein [Bowmanella sp. JS7-9]TBX23117.1 hypothetical protein TK45_07825 [Bowmanella sp. JS7-9]
MNKLEKYKRLVNKRKEFDFGHGLLNPSEINDGIYDCEEIGAWSQWQGNLDAKILLIGQDWGDIDYFTDNKGQDIDQNPTNKNLIELFRCIGIEIGTPSTPNKSAPVFFTNSILGIKEEGKMAGKVNQSWARQCTKEFLTPLIEIIEPKIIITLGTHAFSEVAYLYGLKKSSLKNILASSPEISIENKLICPRFHCGGRGLANRKLDLQKQDWLRIVV